MEEGFFSRRTWLNVRRALLEWLGFMAFLAATGALILWTEEDLGLGLAWLFFALASPLMLIVMILRAIRWRTRGDVF